MDPFEQSADMRLLELQRKALGIEAPPRPNWSGTHTDMNEAIPLQEDAPPVLRGRRITVDLAATPNAKLIPGAVVTLSLAIHNNGEQSIDGVRVAVPMPGSATYRPGSLQVDQRPLTDADADRFFGESFDVPKLEAGRRLGFVWKISVQPGTKPLVISPRVSAEGAGVTGGAPILLSRGAAPTSSKLPKAYAPAQDEPERPFYELDAAEERDFEHEGVTGNEPAFGHEAPLFVMPDVLPAEQPQPQPEPEPEPEPEPAPEPVQAYAAAEPEPEPEPVVEVEPQPEPRLYCAFDSASLALVKKLFTSESYGQIPHYVLQNSLACALSGTRHDAGVRTHVSQQAGLLSRALLMHKLNKPMHVADFSTGKTGFDLAPAAEPSSDAPASALYMPLTQAEVEFCAPVEGRNPLESFIRIRQIAVALQARRALVADEELARRAEALLEAYATSARAAINRTFIRAKLDKNFDPFGAADPVADKLAHELIDVLALVLAA